MGNNVGKTAQPHTNVLLQSDDGIRLALAKESGMESEDSDHTSLMITCPVLSGYDMFCSSLAPYDDKHIYGIRERKIAID